MPPRGGAPYDAPGVHGIMCGRRAKARPQGRPPRGRDKQSTGSRRQQGNSMMTTSIRPSAATDVSADHRPKVSPETEPSRDKRVKRPPSEAELRPALPPEVQGLCEPPVAAIREDMCAGRARQAPAAEAMLPPDPARHPGPARRTAPPAGGRSRRLRGRPRPGGAGPRPEGHRRVAQRERHSRRRLGGGAPQAPQDALPHTARGGRAVRQLEDALEKKIKDQQACRPSPSA